MSISLAPKSRDAISNSERARCMCFRYRRTDIRAAPWRLLNTERETLRASHVQCAGYSEPQNKLRADGTEIRARGASSLRLFKVEPVPCIDFPNQ
jgi:hypothetical protein